MTAKEFLSQAWEIDRRIENRIEERERLAARLEAGRSANLDGMPRGGRFDWTNAADRIVEMDAAIAGEISRLCAIKRQVNSAIDAVEDSRLRRILELRYRNYMSWERIAEVTSYDSRHVRRLHGEALLCVKVPRDAPAENL